MGKSKCHYNSHFPKLLHVGFMCHPSAVHLQELVQFFFPHTYYSRISLTV